MKKQILHFSVHQTSKILAMMLCIFVALICIPTFIFLVLTGEFYAAICALLAPILYALFSYITYAIFIWMYNFASRFFGGIEFELKDID